MKVPIVNRKVWGGNRTPAGAKAQFSVESFFAGGQGSVRTRAFNGPLEGQFSFTDKMRAKSSVWSACGNFRPRFAATA